MDKMWAGRFHKALDSTADDFNSSIHFDSRMYKEDISGSVVHAMMLARQGIITEDEKKKIISGLGSIVADIDAGRLAIDMQAEDIHMFVESELTKRIGDAGKKLHTARSRNDQVALDIRMYLLSECEEIGGLLKKLLGAIRDIAAEHKNDIMPGYTHLQRAQPVYFSHHLMAYMEMFDRDYSRLTDAYKRVNVSPLGAGAIAGSTLPINRELTAKLLEFVDEEGVPQVAHNSMDAISDRDFMLEFAFICSLIAVHISRLAEDFILWSSSEFSFITVSDAYTTGSSLMPQKKNMDIAELSRGKTGRVVGNLVSLLVLLKGLPMTYNRDLQEDKERIFDSWKTVLLTLDIWANMLKCVNVRADSCRKAASDPALLATDLVDYLVLKGMPFRLAHHAVGELVALAEKKNVLLCELGIDDFQKVNALFEKDVLEVFQLEKAMDKKHCIGSGGTKEKQKELKQWESRLAKYSL